MEQTEIQAFRVIVPKLPYQSLHSSIQWHCIHVFHTCTSKILDMYIHETT
jgi:hypothetical protein